MGSDLFNNYQNSITDSLMSYFEQLKVNPFMTITLIVDIFLVTLLCYICYRLLKRTRATQVFKGILILVIATYLSNICNLKILNIILSTIMNFGILALIIIFQPELRRALEQLGSNKITKFFGITKDMETKTKEDIYKTVIAARELSKAKVGGLIVFERDINIADIKANGIEIDAIVSPQLLVNIFNPKTPLHDGAVIISKNKIASAACILPLYNNPAVSKEFGTRHRAGLGISKETDAIALIVSEETGNISLAKDGELIQNLDEEHLKKFLIDNLVNDRFNINKKNNKNNKEQTNDLKIEDNKEKEINK